MPLAGGLDDAPVVLGDLPVEELMAQKGREPSAVPGQSTARTHHGRPFGHVQPL